MHGDFREGQFAVDNAAVVLEFGQRRAQRHPYAGDVLIDVPVQHVDLYILGDAQLVRC
ncbi:Uncharacterised protein [Mycobacteroides abscessus subsp. abscessus]|nr:Uncharacterised protein [Mycobacteroides abscessus subsp. abscessus]SHZ73317.1 Uncharacterised protein [Mycobacteroides abscessus subsp. abscessus]SII28140.1 Uncharacterised protein [Mycobacteroides abscessus subsp. abscessus]